MYNQNIDSVLRKIERETREELVVFRQFGAVYFTLEELEKLHRRWKVTIHFYERLFGLFIIMSAGSFLCIPTAFVLGIIGLQHLALFMLTLCPCCFLVGFTGAVLLYIKYGSFTFQLNIGAQLLHAIYMKRSIQ
ncbi:MAG: hypothetical protein SFU99_06275 [Saprospiraceae bacterium]|nr:hypothetical protein [Saprospiraceae bacterium]